MSNWNPAVILYDASGNPIELGNGQPVAGNLRSSFSPNPWSYSTGSKGDALLDSSGSLQIRGPVHTDEGSFRDHFNGSSLSTALTGTPSFTNGSTTVTGSGTAFTSEVNPQMYVKRDADGEAYWARVAEVISDTELELTEPYGGATGASASSWSNWVTDTTGSITVGSSTVVITNGLASGNDTSISRLVDYGPLYVQFLASCGTRVTNQNAYIGLVDDVASPSERAVVLFDAALGNTQVIFRTTINGNTEDTTVTLPNGGVTTAEHRYAITLTGQSVALHIDGAICAFHTSQIPLPYTVMWAVAEIENTAAVGSTTTLTINWLWANNANRVEIANSFSGEPIPSQIVGKNPSGLPQQVSVGSGGGLFVQPVEFATFQAFAADVALNTNKSLLSLFLDGASTQLLKLRAIYIRNTQLSAITGTVVTFNLETITGHSAGTVITPTARDSNDTLPSAVSARTGATVTGASSAIWRWEWSSDEWTGGALDTEGFQAGLQDVFPNFSKKDPALKPFVLRPGEGYHIKCATTTTVGSFDLIFVFTVEDD